MLDRIRETISNWIVGIFVSSVKHIPQPQERVEAVNWLSASRDIVASNLNRQQKFAELYKRLDGRKVLSMVFHSVSGAVKAYAKSDLPLAAKIALPATVAAVPLFGGQGAGIAAFGTAIGMPVLLLIFIGAAGITAIIEACATSETARAYVSSVMDQVAKDEAFRAFRNAMRRGDQGAPEAPFRHDMPMDDQGLREQLLAMDPDAFEKQVMSFFVGNGLSDAAVTQSSGDKGIDGFARHEKGLIVVQCKRYSTDNKVGGPAIREFKGAMADFGAWKGYFVPTSGFTRDAMESAEKSADLMLVDMDRLIEWHFDPPNFATLN